MALETFPKTKLEIVIESAVVPKVLSIAEECGALGYTVLPVANAHGQSGDWMPNPLSEALSAQMVIVVAGSDVAEKVADQVKALLAKYAGIVLVSEVGVLRPDQF